MQQQFTCTEKGDEESKLCDLPCLQVQDIRYLLLIVLTKQIAERTMHIIQYRMKIVPLTECCLALFKVQPCSFIV